MIKDTTINIANLKSKEPKKTFVNKLLSPILGLTASWYPINAEISSDTAIKNIEEPSDEVKALIKSFVEIQRDKLKERFFE